MQGKSSYTGLLITALCGVASGLVRELFNVDSQMNSTDAHRYCSEHYTGLASIEDAAGLDGSIGWFSDSQFTFYCFEEMTLVHEKKTWEEAVRYCRKHFTDIVSLLSENENNVAMRKIQEEIKNTTDSPLVWMGLCFHGGYWLWVNGDALEYENREGWDDNCSSAFPCGSINTKKLHWGSGKCERKLKFICYRE
ncbi:unnamed protein product [Coregonus sp. 'balchen']|nr:unnamed protein product [Coregonus sp. 'balchen']